MNNFDATFVTLLKVFNDDSLDFRTALSCAKSKCIEKGFSVIEDYTENIDNYVIVLVVKQDKTRICYWYRDIFSFTLNGAVANIGDGFLFSGSTKYSIPQGKVDKYVFKVIDKPVHGNGQTIFRAEIIFSDKYYLDVYANSQDEAIDTAYEVGMEEWIHEWPEDKELDRWQNTRKSVWGKKMIRVVERNA